MLHMNRVTLLGHAGRDPRGRELGEGERTTSFTVATSRRWKADSGEAVEKTEWHRIVVYGNAVKPAEDMVRKGSLVLVEGRLATREYDDSKGIRRQVTEVIVAGPQGVVNVLSPKPATGEGAAPVPEKDDGGGDGDDDA
ncbi:MAG: single-stranded DNA-binding protein [Rhodospirillales bacterium]|nr:single-stranded DNA-binding protein [Rhodospirillales bacterium]